MLKEKLRNLLSNLKDLFFIAVVLLVVFQWKPEWFSLAENHVQTFWKTEEILHAIQMDKTTNHGIGFLLEGFSLGGLCYWLFGKGRLKAVNRLRVLMLFSSSTAYLLWLMLSVLDIPSTYWFLDFTGFLQTHSYSILDLLFFGYQEEHFALFLLLGGVYLVAVFLNALNGQMLTNHHQIRLRKDDLESLGIMVLLKTDHHFSFPFLYQRPQFYVDPNLVDNAFSVGRRIILSGDLLVATRREELLGIVAHELGHHHYQDSEADNLCNIAMIVFLLPLNLFALLFSMPSLLPVVGRLWTPVAMLSSFLTKAIGWILSLMHKAFYILDGRRMEMRADRYSALLGQKEGLKKALEKEPSKLSLLDVHPSSRARIRKLKEWHQ